MEVLKEFLLFGVVEIFILFMFYRNIAKFIKVKYWHMVILCPMLIIIGLCNILYSKQFYSIVVITIYLIIVLKNHFVKILKYVTMSFLFLLIIEMMVCVVLDILISFDFSKVDNFKKFLIMIPIRILEIFIILLYKDGVQEWVGFGCRTLKKLKKKK